MFDIIKGGQVIDGTGAPAFRADVTVKEGKLTVFTGSSEGIGAELENMESMLREAMENGAMGMTTGLIYPPGGFSKQDELTELCQVVAEYNCVYATHMRGV